MDTSFGIILKELKKHGMLSSPCYDVYGNFVKDVNAKDNVFKNHHSTDRPIIYHPIKGWTPAFIDMDTLINDTYMNSYINPTMEKLMITPKEVGNIIDEIAEHLSEHTED